MQRTITVFGSAFPQAGSEQYEFAYQLGKKLAENNYSVCTGGYGGIMEAISKGAYDVGGNIFGVTLENWKSEPNSFITVEVRTKNLFDRISKLINLGDAYVVLQGGTGTLLELAAIWELMNKNLIKLKPIVCHSELWNGIVNLMNKQLELENRKTDLIDLAGSVDEIILKLNIKLL